MSIITKPTKLVLEGVGSLTIRPNDYVTQGGEGVIYRKGDRILKLALNQKHFTASGKLAKVQLLRSSLSHPSIVVPSGLVTDDAGKVLGFHLPFVEGEPYPRIFTTTWQKQYQFGTPETTKLAAAMHEVVAHAHRGGALMVDGNELNWLADVKNLRQPVPFIIDVDSWQIGQFKASVVMPSIRDWHRPLSQESDWFAWGVVTFNLYTGIHPYKGTLPGYKPGELDRRMKENASVFRPETRLATAVRDFTGIPGPLLDWYRATFEDGERSLPPSPLQTGVANTTIGRVLRSVITQSGGLMYERLFERPGTDVISIWPCGVVRLSDDSLVDINTNRTITRVSRGRVAVAAREGGHLIAEKIGARWQFRFVSVSGNEQPLSLQMPVTGVLRNGERLFVTTDTELVELTLQSFARPILTVGRRWQILGNSTTWLSGFGVSDVLGAMHLVLPIEADAVAMVRTPELDGLRIVDGIAFGRIATVMTINANGQYRVFTFAGEKNWRGHSTTARDADGPELNLTVLPKGVTAEIREDGELTITVPTQGDVKVVNDKDLLTTMELRNLGDKVVYPHHGALWTLRMT